MAVPRFISSITYHALYFLWKIALRRKLKIREFHRERVPRRGAVILAANHVKDLDSVMIVGAAGRLVHFLAKAVLWQPSRKISLKFVKLILRLTGQIPVHAGDKKLNDRAFATAEEYLRRGDAVGIHVEGTRTNDGRLHRPKLGFTKLTRATHAPVLPVVLRYRPDPEVEFGEIIPYREYQKWSAEEFGAELQRRLAKLSGQKISRTVSPLIDKGDTTIVGTVFKPRSKPQ